MSDIGSNSATNTNDFGGGLNTFTIDLRGLGNERLLIIIYKNERRKYFFGPSYGYGSQEYELKAYGSLIQAWRM